MKDKTGFWGLLRYLTVLSVSSESKAEGREGGGPNSSKSVADSTGIPGNEIRDLNNTEYRGGPEDECNCM